MNSPARGHTAIALGTSWLASGGSFIGMRVVTEALPPVTVTAIRMVGAGLILALPFAWRLRDPRHRPAGREIGNAVVSALLLLVMGQMMLVIGVSMTPAGTAAVFGSSSPLILALLAWGIVGEPVGRRRWIGLGLGFAGLVLLGADALSAGSLAPAGVAAILVSTVAWAAGSLFGERRALPRDPVVSITLQTLVAAVVITALVPMSGELARVDLAAVPGRAWAAMAFVIGTGLALFSSFTWLNAHVSGSLANTFTYVAPVLTLILAALLLGEPLTSGKVAAAVVTLAGVALIISVGREPRRSDG